jgi:hypothetical protein
VNSVDRPIAMPPSSGTTVRCQRSARGRATTSRRIDITRHNGTSATASAKAISSGWTITVSAEKVPFTASRRRWNEPGADQMRPRHQ